MRSDQRSVEALRSYQRPEWRDVQRLVLEGRRLRAEWLRERAGRVGAVVRRWLEGVIGGRRRQAELRALLALDDRVLDDIGLRRGELTAVLYGVMPWEEVAAARRARLTEPSARVLVLTQPERAVSAYPEVDRAA